MTDFPPLPEPHGKTFDEEGRPVNGGHYYPLEMHQYISPVLVERDKLKAELAKHQESEFHPDWSMLKATRASLKEHQQLLRDAWSERDNQCKAADHWMGEANKEHNDNVRLREQALVLRRALEKLERMLLIDPPHQFTALNAAKIVVDALAATNESSVITPLSRG